MASARPTTLAIFVILAALSSMSAGCTSPAPSTLAQGDSATPGVGATPTLDSTLDQRLPIEKYLISPQENDRIEGARSALMTSCMKRFGFDFKPVETDYRQKWNQTSHRYDPTDPALAAIHGYHGPQSGGQSPVRPSRAPLSPDMEVVLGHGIGAPTPPGTTRPPANGKYHGIPIPKGGCMGEAEEKLTAGGGIIQDSPMAIDINFKNYVRSMADTKLKAVFAEWSACMKAKGYSYPTPEAAVKDPAWGTPTPSKRELATASADATCKRQNNVVGTWFAIESAYEMRDIQVNGKQMASIRHSIDIALRNAVATRTSGS
ncbi:hypothetical protein ACH4ND_33710 [Streptomyces sp. NPDC017179]|uniref:hypothetical protein n=1 Tax=Streptomyces sp. NPDC017179 TaxID=3364979 RepID=UPI0037935C89